MVIFHSYVKLPEGMAAMASPGFDEWIKLSVVSWDLTYLTCCEWVRMMILQHVSIPLECIWEQRELHCEKGTQRLICWNPPTWFLIFEPYEPWIKLHNISWWTLTFSPFWSWASHPNHGPLTGHVLNMFNRPTGCMWLAVSTASKEINPFRSSSHIPGSMQT